MPPATPSRALSTISCRSGGGWKASPSGTILGRLVGNLAWLTIACIVIGLIVLVALPAAHDWNVRPFSDPMVFTHLAVVLPLAVAFYKRMHWTAGLLGLSTIASMFYHVFREDDLGFTIADSYLANVVLLWSIVIFAVSITLCPDKEVTWMIVTLLVLAITFWMAQVFVKGKENRRCMRWRLHPMWHMLAYAAVALVLANYNKDFVQAALTRSGEGAEDLPAARLYLSRRNWLHTLQTFSW